MVENEFGYIAVGERLRYLNNCDNKVAISMDNILYVFVCLRNITPREIELCNNGSFEIGLLEVDGVLFITFHQDNVLKAETAFNANLCDRSSFDNLEPFPEGVGYGCTIVGIDSMTGIVKSLRVVGLGTEFSNGLKKYIKKQLADESFDAEEFKYKSSHALFEQSSDEMHKNQKYVYRHKAREEG